MPDHDVLIIGAGLAGLTAAAALAADAGRRVFVLDQAAGAGGRAISFRGGEILDAEDHARTLRLAALSEVSHRSDPPFEEMLRSGLLSGYSLEAGVRANWRLNRARVSRLMDHYNKSIDWHASQGFVRLAKDNGYRPAQMTANTPPEWMSPTDLAETMKVTAARDAIGWENAADYDHVTLKDWLYALTDNAAAREFHANRCAFHTLVNDPALNTVGEDVRVNHIFKSDPGCTIESGFWGFAGAPGHRFMIDNLIEVIVAHGGRVALNASVRSIIVEGGHAAGVEVDLGAGLERLSAPICICTVRPDEVGGLIDLNHIDEALRVAAAHSVRAGCLSCYIGMDRPITDLARATLPPRAFIWNPALACAHEGFRGDIPLVGVDVSAIAPTRAPENKHLIGWAANLLAEEAGDPAKRDLIIDRILEFLDEAFPGWRRHADWTLFLVNYGALIWRRPEDKRPATICARTPGLYFAGEAYGEGVNCQGTEGAVQSALFAVEAITGLALRKPILGDVLA